MNTPANASSRNHPENSAEVTMLLHETEALRQQNLHLCEQLKSLQVQVQRQQLHFDQQIQKTLSTLPAKSNQQSDEVDHLKEEIESLKEDIDRFKQENEHYKQQVNYLEEDNDELKEEIISLKQENENLKCEYRRFEHENRGLKQENDRCTEENVLLKMI